MRKTASAVLLSALLFTSACADMGEIGTPITSPSPIPGQATAVASDGREYTQYGTIDEVPLDWRIAGLYSSYATLSLTGNEFAGQTGMRYFGTTTSLHTGLEVTFETDPVASVAPPAKEDHYVIPRSESIEKTLGYTVPRSCGHWANFYGDGWVAQRFLINWSVTELDKKSYSKSDAKNQPGCTTDDGSSGGGSTGGSGGGSGGTYGECIVYVEYYQDTGEIINPGRFNMVVLACY